jgi:hypothetical protein
MRRIAEELQSAGQDVGLHTHPQWAYDPARNGMDQYTLDEQTAIIRDGVRLLSEWTGRAVVAHRAGDYAADERTLEALRTNGIKVDSSLFFGRPSSALNELALPRNLVSSPGGMIEVPVSVYLRDERPRFLATHFPSVTSIRKVDCDWLEDEDTARAVIDSLVSADPQFIVVFLHSFSFTAGKEATGRAIENRHSRRILEAILDRVKEKGLEVVTMRDIAAAPPPITSARPDVLPIVTTKVPIYRYAWHWWHFHRTPGKRALALASGFAGLVVLAVIVVIVSGRMRRRRRSLTPT